MLTGDFQLHSIFLNLLEDYREFTRLSRNYRMLDDFDQLAKLVRELLQRIDYTECSARDRYIFDAINNDFLAKALVILKLKMRNR